MKKSEVPQQKGALGTIKEMCYATDENGNYTTTLSSGWDVKSTALEASLQYIDEQLSEAKKLVSEGVKKPYRVLYDFVPNGLERFSWIYESLAMDSQTAHKSKGFCQVIRKNIS